MSYEIKLTSHDEQVSNLWSGGSTTQLAIYPENSQYADRNFDWRISTATVEAEESEFSDLTGYDRHLMILDGSVKLEHYKHHSIALLPFEMDSFSGSWKTKSIGKGEDFNLMLGEGWRGNIRAFSFSGKQITAITRVIEKEYFLGVYCFSGKIVLSKSQIDIACLNKKDFVLITIRDGAELSIISDSISDVIVAYVCQNE